MFFYVTFSIVPNDVIRRLFFYNNHFNNNSNGYVYQNIIYLLISIFLVTYDYV
jgi:hypothetical protein